MLFMMIDIMILFMFISNGATMITPVTTLCYLTCGTIIHPVSEFHTSYFIFHIWYSVVLIQHYGLFSLHLDNLLYPIATEFNLPFFYCSMHLYRDIYTICSTLGIGGDMWLDLWRFDSDTLIQTKLLTIN